MSWHFFHVSWKTPLCSLPPEYVHGGMEFGGCLFSMSWEQSHQHRRQHQQTAVYLWHRLHRTQRWSLPRWDQTEQQKQTNKNCRKKEGNDVDFKFQQKLFQKQRRITIALQMLWFLSKDRLIKSRSALRMEEKSVHGLTIISSQHTSTYLEIAAKNSVQTAVVTCTLPNVPINGDRGQCGTNVGNTCSFTCDPGETLACK